MKCLPHSNRIFNKAQKNHYQHLFMYLSVFRRAKKFFRSQRGNHVIDQHSNMSPDHHGFVAKTPFVYGGDGFVYTDMFNHGQKSFNTAIPRFVQERIT